jgi:hypothetical protein
MPQRSITDDEISLIKTMLKMGMGNKDIQFYFNRQDRAVNSGRISGIKNGTYGPEIAAAPEEHVTDFMAKFQMPGIAPAALLSSAVASAPPDPASEAVVRLFFRRSSDGVWRCAAGETDQHECKEGFHLRNFGKALRTIAGFANNRGGYLFFGVRDKPHGFEVSGLADGRFANVDQKSFSQTIRAALDPTPRFASLLIDLDGKKVGVIYVEPHPGKPVMARKNEGDLAEGAIYFRYPGETRLISYADLRALLDERDRQTRTSIAPLVQRVLELGPKDALVANLADRTLEGGLRPILIDERLIEQIKFIMEGNFDEREGADTLRVIGEVSPVPTNSLTPVRTVREEITEDAILRNFIMRNPVDQPLAYVRQASHEQSWLLPIFYYLDLAGQTRSDAIKTLERHRNAKPKTRQEMIARIAGRSSLYLPAGGKRMETLRSITSRAVGGISNQLAAKAVADAVQGIPATADVDTDYIHDLLQKVLEEWERHPHDRVLLSALRRASAYLDEIEFGPRVPKS